MLCLLVYTDKNTNEVEAKDFLDEYNSTAEEVWNAYTEASWSYNTDINEENKQEMVSKSGSNIWGDACHSVSMGTSISDGPALFSFINVKIVAVNEITCVF